MVKKGDTVQIRPEWRDPADELFHWIAVDDETDGRVTISPLGTGLSITPRMVVKTFMIDTEEKAQ